MADEKHLKILRKGVDCWNQWRKSNPGVKPDLSFSNLFNANLSKADLNNALLYDIGFSNAILGSADLNNAILYNGDLRFTHLKFANLSNAEISKADLSNADLNSANLSNANLNSANLSYANLSYANLSYANLTKIRALDAKFLQANLTGACIEDWHINSATQLDDVICDYIFLRSNQQERRPSDRNKIFAPGDFARLVRKSLETVDLIFSNGIDWKAFALSLEDLRVEYAEQELSIQAIENKNDAFVIRLNVPPDANKEAIERQAKEFYETRLAVLEAQYRSQLQAKDEQIAIYREKSADMTEIVKLLANRPIDVKAIAVAENKPTENFNTDLRGANVANFANKLQDNARQQANQHIYTAEQRQTLAEAAADIQQLLEQLSQTNPTTTQSEKLAVATKAAEAIEQNPALKSRVIGALKAGGAETLKELIDHPLVNILLAALEGWQQPE
jgi:uncharacterized protein YjbI with pentapeptide repeats